MKLSIDYKRIPHQREFHEDFASKFLHLSTGLGGGKTFSLCMKAIKFRWINNLSSGGITAPTYPELKKDVIPTMVEILESNNIPFRYHQTDKVFSFPWCKGKIYCFTADRKIRGPNLSDMGINEATLISKQSYMDCVGRVRVKGAKHLQVYSSGTPEGVANYIYELFIEKPMKDSRIIYGSTMDNITNLAESYIDSLRASYDSISLAAYLNGLWVNMNGNQFYYSYSPEKNEDKSIQRDQNKLVCAALDFNVQHMTCTLWHQTHSGIVGFDEIYLENNADTNKMAEALLARGYTPTNTTIYPDPAGRSRSTRGAPDHEILRQKGFNVVSRLSAPRMRERQLNMNNKLEKSWIKYNPDTMPKLRKDLLGVEQDPATFEKVKKDAKLTHASDGLDYLVDVLSPFVRPSRSESVTFR